MAPASGKKLIELKDYDHLRDYGYSIDYGDVRRHSALRRAIRIKGHL